MFNNIIYFIIVLFIFTINTPEKVLDSTLATDLFNLLFTWIIFAAYCRWRFSSLLKKGRDPHRIQDTPTASYHHLIFRLSILSIVLFILAIHVMHLRYWIQMIPGAAHFDTLQGSLALALFLVYLCTVWYFAFSVYKRLFLQEHTRRSFLMSHVRLNLPVVFPWFILTLIYDLLSLSQWSWTDRFLNSTQGNIILYILFLVLLIIYLPVIIQYWWGCRPLEMTEKVKTMHAFVRSRRFKYKHLLNWPVFEGRMMTAGIMGLIPRYRYILISKSLMEMLSNEELEAVLAHEMGHVRYHHLLFYVLFFAGFVIVSAGLEKTFYTTLLLLPSFNDIIIGNNFKSMDIYFIVMPILMLTGIIIYFRFIMGFFMRNFERQADLYSAEIMETPRPIINSLEKISRHSGNTRDMPSWHHFSIRQRVEYLEKVFKEPTLLKLHNRFVVSWILFYFLCVMGISAIVYWSPLNDHLSKVAVAKVIHHQLLQDPNNIDLLESAAMISHELGNLKPAIQNYEGVIKMSPNRATALNNLAWIFVTAKDHSFRDPPRALNLAQKAVSLDSSSAVFLDTLAETYFANGLISDAVRTAEQALSAALENRTYYVEQRDRFLKEKGIK